jgi:hypothetical protein
MRSFKKRARIEAFQIFIKVAFLNYLVFSFTAWDLNFVNWSTVLRGVFSGITVTWGLLVIIVVNKILKDDRCLNPPKPDEESRWEKRLKEVQEAEKKRREGTTK